MDVRTAPLGGGAAENEDSACITTAISQSPFGTTISDTSKYKCFNYSHLSSIQLILSSPFFGRGVGLGNPH